ncbi:hypothetical protein [Leucobacter sp.]
MTHIYLDRESMERRLADVIERVDAADTAIGGMPDTPDAGIATSLVAFIASAGAEASGLAADTARALSAIAIDVIDDMSNTDSMIAEQLREVERELDDR